MSTERLCSGDCDFRRKVEEDDKLSTQNDNSQALDIRMFFSNVCILQLLPRTPDETIAATQNPYDHPDIKQNETEHNTQDKINVGKNHLENYIN